MYGSRILWHRLRDPSRIIPGHGKEKKLEHSKVPDSAPHWANNHRALDLRRDEKMGNRCILGMEGTYVNPDKG